MPRRLLSFALLSATAMMAVEANAFDCTLSDASPFVSVHWEQREIPYAIRAPGATSITAESTLELVQASFGAWETPRCSDLTFQYGGVVDPTTEPRDISQVIFLQQGWTDGGRSGAAVALTTMTYGISDGVIRFGIIEVNEEIYRFSDTRVECPNNDAYDLGAVLTHEAGHFIGLAHTSVGLDGPEDRAPTMTAMIGQCDGELRSLEPDDIEGLCFIYPDKEATRQCGTLPVQDEPYVQGVAFGCTTSGGTPSALVLLAGLMLLVRLRACSWSRSRS